MYKRLSEILAVSITTLLLSNCSGVLPNTGSEDPTLIPRATRILLPTFTVTGTSTAEVLASKTPTKTLTPTVTEAPTVTLTPTLQNTPTRIASPTATRRSLIPTPTVALLPTITPTRRPLYETERISAEPNCGISRVVITLMKSDGSAINGETFILSNLFGTSIETGPTGKNGQGTTDALINRGVDMKWILKPKLPNQPIAELESTANCDKPDGKNVFNVTVKKNE